MDEKTDVLAMLEGVVPDQPASEPKVKVGDKELTPSEIKAQLDEYNQWKGSYTQTRQAEKSELNELRAEIQALKEIAGQPKNTREETAALVGDILQGIESRGKSKLPVGDEDYLTGKNLKDIAEFVKSQLPANPTDARVKAMESQMAQMAEMMVRQNVENDVAKVMQKYPEANREEVLGIAMSRLINKQSLDIERIAQTSHARHSLDNIDIDKLPPAKVEAILRKIVDQEKKKRAEQMTPDAGGRPPEAVDEEFISTIKDRKKTLTQKFDAADKVAEKLNRMRE